MKPPAFDYHDPATLDEVLALLAEAGDEAAIIAGGQSLVPLMNLRLARPEVVIDPRRVGDLRSVESDATGMSIGAMVTAATLERASGTVPGTAAALAHLAHPQIRNRTTVGGSIAHADPAAELPALLAATDGTVTVASAGRGTRVVDAADFLQGPFWTAREPDEMVTSVRFGRFDGEITVAELAPRPGDFATVGVVVGLRVDNGQVGAARIVAFGVGGTPVRMSEVEASLVGSAADAAGFAAAGDAVRAGLDPTGDAHASADYRRHVAGTLVTRALLELAGVAR
ncbi:MAG: FAD binding domain-containing protein [Acidimicrobiales bacterium]